MYSKSKLLCLILIFSIITIIVITFYNHDVSNINKSKNDNNIKNLIKTNVEQNIKNPKNNSSKINYILDNVSNIIESPQFYGSTNEHQPFKISADKAQEIEKFLIMTNVNSLITLNNGNVLKLNAGNGQLEVDKKILHTKDGIMLDIQSSKNHRTDVRDINSRNGTKDVDNINVNKQRKYVIKAKNLTVDYIKQVAYSNTPIEIKSNDIYINANTGKLDLNNNTIELKGNVKIAIG